MRTKRQHINKGRRHEVKMLKYKKRLKQLRLQEGKGNFYAYRSHGKPCSCSLCRNMKFDRRNPQRRGDDDPRIDYSLNNPHL